MRPISSILPRHAQDFFQRGGADQDLLAPVLADGGAGQAGMALDLGLAGVLVDLVADGLVHGDELVDAGTTARQFQAAGCGVQRKRGSAFVGGDERSVPGEARHQVG